MITTTFVTPRRRLVQIGLWIAQTLVAVTFCGVGYLKLTTPIAQLSHAIPWTGQLPKAVVRTLGVIDIAGGLGILLPFLTRIKPGIGVLAALCCVLLQICAIMFHLSRHEIDVLPLNFILLPLCIFILWGRSKRASRRGASTLPPCKCMGIRS